MTTIVFRRAEGVAADKLVSGPSNYLTTKVHELSGGRYIALAGLADDILKIVDILQSDDPQKKVKPAGTPPPEGILVDGVDVYHVWIGEGTSRIRIAEIESDIFAVGSGADYAIGAMAMGADLRTAIEVASRYDSYTSQSCDVMPLAEGAP